MLALVNGDPERWHDMAKVTQRVSADSSQDHGRKALEFMVFLFLANVCCSLSWHHSLMIMWASMKALWPSTWELQGEVSTLLTVVC